MTALPLAHTSFVAPGPVGRTDIDAQADLALGRVTGALATKRAATLRTAIWGLAMVAPAATFVIVGGAPTILLVGAVALAVVGPLFLAGAAIELLPTPSTLVFHEHGVVAHGRDGLLTTFAYDGSSEQI